MGSAPEPAGENTMRASETHANPFFMIAGVASGDERKRSSALAASGCRVIFVSAPAIRPARIAALPISPEAKRDALGFLATGAAIAEWFKSSPSLKPNYLH